jgi:hypothetical protein
MKGMVFTEFMDMVSDSWSYDMVDTIISKSNVASGGSYTAVGNYPHEEIIALVVALSEETKIPVPDLVHAFGKHMFGRFAALFPRFFNNINGSFEFLSGIEQVIHAEVRKLYPDAELPTFEVESSPGKLVMTYISTHPFADLAHGLIDGCIAHYGENVKVTRDSVEGIPGAQARFTLLKQG